jgi:hypothetical protein
MAAYRPTSITRIIPVEAMAERLAGSKVDLRDERACIIALIDAPFLAVDIEAGLHRAMRRAETLRATRETPFRIIRDLAACLIFCLAVGAWALVLG